MIEAPQSVSCCVNAKSTDWEVSPYLNWQTQLPYVLRSDEHTLYPNLQCVVRKTLGSYSFGISIRVASDVVNMRRHG